MFVRNSIHHSIVNLAIILIYASTQLKISTTKRLVYFQNKTIKQLPLSAYKKNKQSKYKVGQPAPEGLVSVCRTWSKQEESPLALEQLESPEKC